MTAAHPGARAAREQRRSTGYCRGLGFFRAASTGARHVTQRLLAPSPYRQHG
ncbi:hypothetical protein ACIP93_37405 [Streptomyces sp. NPDC088745]|uniref:hypothetical protein n=1 Tax=Streptomyces sp. NPDC088745 TaxID=3365884 RepID=UPI0037FFACAE